MKKNLLDQLLNKSEELTSPDRLYHDFAHAKNVMRNAQKLLEEVGGDEIIVLTASLFHDIARDKSNHEIEAAKMLKKILPQIKGFPSDKIEEVCLAVERHEEGQVTHNEKVLSDVDKLDAFNELGIGRGFMMCAKKGFILNETIHLYLELLKKWYSEFYFEESKEIVKKDYANTKALLEKMLSMY